MPALGLGQVRAGRIPSAILCLLQLRRLISRMFWCAAGLRVTAQWPALAVAQEISAAGGPGQTLRARARHVEHVHAMVKGQKHDLQRAVTVHIRHRRRRGCTNAVFFVIVLSW